MFIILNFNLLLITKNNKNVGIWVFEKKVTSNVIVILLMLLIISVFYECNTLPTEKESTLRFCYMQ